MRTRLLFITGLLILLFSCQSRGQEYKYLENPVSGISAASGIEKPVTVKVLYDNYLKVDGLKEDWGFSILIEGLDKKVLFDTGTNPEIFASNFSKMGNDASAIDFLVISHEHGDHTGGIEAFADMKKDIPVIIPHSFSDKFKGRMTDLGLEPMLINKPVEICHYLYTSGEFEFQTAEQALVLDTKNGLVVMTGCSHPGIVKMLNKIKSDFNKNIYMVFGGFHLLQKSDREMNEIITGMKSLGIIKCGATHCTGDKQIGMFKEAFGNNYVELGVGNTLVIN